MKPDSLSKIAKLMYGERWQTSLAHDLYVTDRTVRRWAIKGSPAWADKKIYAMGQETISALKEILSNCA